MGWEDRPYYRDNPGGLSANPIIRALNGSVPLFTAFGIRVRASSWLLIFMAWIIFLGTKNDNLPERAVWMACLAVTVILHEFGHCFAARSVGGTAEDILLWPLGGLAFTSPPHRPWPNFWTSAAGPLVNLAICIVAGAAVYGFTSGSFSRPDASHLLVPLNPFARMFWYWPYGLGFSNPAFYFWWLYLASYIQLLFNLLPIYPLDGGQMFQAAIWPHFGYFRSMNIALIAGMVGGGALIIFGLVQWNLMIVSIGLVGIMYCRQRRMIHLEMGHEPWSDDTGGVDYNASIYGHDEPKPKRKRLNRRAIAQARKIAQAEADERNRIDTILAKVSAQGMASLTWSERRTLRKATERQRERETEMSKYQ